MTVSRSGSVARDLRISIVAAMAIAAVAFAVPLAAAGSRHRPAPGARR
jgi:hypothetical protein